MGFLKTVGVNGYYHLNILNCHSTSKRLKSDICSCLKPREEAENLYPLNKLYKVPYMCNNANSLCNFFMTSHHLQLFNDSVFAEALKEADLRIEISLMSNLVPLSHFVLQLLVKI